MNQISFFLLAVAVVGLWVYMVYQLQKSRKPEPTAQEIHIRQVFKAHLDGLGSPPGTLLERLRWFVKYQQDLDPVRAQNLELDIARLESEVGSERLADIVSDG